MLGKIEKTTTQRRPDALIQTIRFLIPATTCMLTNFRASYVSPLPLLPFALNPYRLFFLISTQNGLGVLWVKQGQKSVDLFKDGVNWVE